MDKVAIYTSGVALLALIIFAIAMLNGGGSDENE